MMVSLLRITVHKVHETCSVALFYFFSDFIDNRLHVCILVNSSNLSMHVIRSNNQQYQHTKGLVFYK